MSATKEERILVGKIVKREISGKDNTLRIMKRKGAPWREKRAQYIGIHLGLTGPRYFN